MKRKIVATLLATVMAMSVFTGCGSKDKDNEETKSTTMGDSTTTGDSTTAGSAETTISVSLDNLTEGEPEIKDVTIETDNIIVGQYKGVEIEKVEVEAVTDEDIEDALYELVYE